MKLMGISLLYYGVQLLAGLIAFVTVWGWLPLDHWWVRGVDFPRIQIMVLVLLLGLVCWLFGQNGKWGSGCCSQL